jgi:tetratricopeptide (TPR) repeat protein
MDKGKSENSSALLRKALELQTAGNLFEAESTYDRVLDQIPTNTDALHLKGMVAFQLGRLEEALNLVRQAIDLYPMSTVYHHNIGIILKVSGDIPNAEISYREAIKINPNYPEAYFNLFQTVKLTRDDPCFVKFKDIIATNETWSPKDVCFIHFAAGKAYEDVEDYERSFFHYHHGNQVKNKNFDIVDHYEFIKSLKRVFTGDNVELMSAHGLRTEVPVFVIGMPRSGTSLVEQILASHPEVHGAGELSLISEIAVQLHRFSQGDSHYPLCMNSIEDGAITGGATDYLERVQELSPESQKIIDKAPMNYRHLGLIASFFPNAKIIHCRRDPLDTCLSCYFQNFTVGHEYSFDLAHLGLFYRCYRRLMDYWKDELSLTLLEVSYEGLVENTEKVSRQMVEFLGLDWDSGCLDFHKTKRPVHTASAWQVRQPVYTTSIGKWRHFESKLDTLVDSLGQYAR